MTPADVQNRIKRLHKVLNPNTIHRMNWDELSEKQGAALFWAVVNELPTAEQLEATPAAIRIVRMVAVYVDAMPPYHYITRQLAKALVILA